MENDQEEYPKNKNEFKCIIRNFKNYDPSEFAVMDIVPAENFEILDKTRKNLLAKGIEPLTN